MRRAMPTRERFIRHARKVVVAGAIGAGLLGGYKTGRIFEESELRWIPRLRQAEIVEMEGRVNAPLAIDLSKVLKGEKLARVNEIVIGKMAAIRDAIASRDLDNRESNLARNYDKVNPKGGGKYSSPSEFMWRASPNEIYSVLTPAEKSEWEGYVKEHQAEFRTFAQEYLANSPAEAKEFAKVTKIVGRGAGGLASALLFALVARAILRRQRLYPK